jgi:carotenoid cleavage dioxygenase-like enzyme
MKEHRVSTVEQTKTPTTTKKSAIQQGLTSADESPERVELPVSGELPSWLTGMLLRNGPGRWEFGGAAMKHWFDGMSMLHSFDFTGGKVHYANRFVRSKAYKSLSEEGEITMSEFGTDPCRTFFKRIQSMFAPSLTDNPAVSVHKFGEQFIALSETPMAWEFDPSTLETIGVAYENPDMFATAHPHADFASGDMLNLSGKLGPRSTQSFFRLAPGSQKAEKIAKFTRKLPTYQHSFGLSDRWLIFTEFPFKVNPVDILRTGRPFIENFKWLPEQNTKLTIVDRESGEIGGEWEAKPGFCFHHVNAFEDGDDVVVDLCRFEDASVVEELYLDSLREDQYVATPYLHRYRLTPGQARATESRLSDEAIELPRINYGKHNGKAYQYTYGVGMDDAQAFDKLVKIDVNSGAAISWTESNCAVGEPVFVAAPGAIAEDEGVLLSVVLDGDAGRSFLLVLDASDMTELARAEVSHHIPAGFHGSYVRA